MLVKIRVIFRRVLKQILLHNIGQKHTFGVNLIKGRIVILQLSLRFEKTEFYVKGTSLGKWVVLLYMYHQILEDSRPIFNSNTIKIVEAISCKKLKLSLEGFG